MSVLHGTSRYPDTKCLQEVTFYVASNNGSVLLFCVTTLALGLIQPHTRLDYLPPRASHITSSTDHPKKTKSQVSAHVSRRESIVYNHKCIVPKLITRRIRFEKLIQMCLMVLDAFLILHTISKLILVSHPSKLLANQSHCIVKNLSNTK